MPESGSHGLHHFLNWTDKNPSVDYQIVKSGDTARVTFVVDSLTEMAAVAQAIGGAWLLLGKLAPAGTDKELAYVHGVAWGLKVEIISREPVGVSAVRVGRAA